MEHEALEEKEVARVREPQPNVASSNKRRSFRSLLAKSSWAQTMSFKIISNKGNGDDNVYGTKNGNGQMDSIKPIKNERPGLFSRRRKRSTRPTLAEQLAELERLDKQTAPSKWQSMTLEEFEKDPQKLPRRRSLGDLFKNIRLSSVKRTKSQDMLQDTQHTGFEPAANDEIDTRHSKTFQCPALGELGFDVKFGTPPEGSLTRHIPRVVHTAEKKTIDTANGQQEQGQPSVMSETSVAHDSDVDDTINQLVAVQKNINSSGKAVERVAVIFPATIEREEHVEYFTGTHTALMAIRNQRKLFANQVLFNPWTDTFYVLPPAFDVLETKAAKNYIKSTVSRLNTQSSSEIDRSISLPTPFKLSACSQWLNAKDSKDTQTAVALETKTEKDVDALAHKSYTSQRSPTHPKSSLNNEKTPLIGSASDKTDLAEKFVEVSLKTMISSPTGEHIPRVNDPWILYQIHKRTGDIAGLTTIPFTRSAEASPRLKVYEYEKSSNSTIHSKSSEDVMAGYASLTLVKASASNNFDETTREGGLDNASRL